MSLQSIDSHINISLGKPYFSPATSNFAINDSNNKGKNDECNIKSSSSHLYSVHLFSGILIFSRSILTVQSLGYIIMKNLEQYDNHIYNTYDF